MRKQPGFTIIELMIATLVFSTILILLSVGLIQIARIYYKGLTTSRIQQTTRNDMDTITQSIQFSGGNVSTVAVDGSTGLSYFCVNSDRYTFQLGKQLTDSSTPGPNQAKHVLVKDTVGSCTGSLNFGAALPSGATELLGTSMRLSKLSVCIPGMVATTDCPTPPATGSKLYYVSIRVVAGDDDLLCSPALGNCNTAGSMTSAQFAAARDLQCKNATTGGQFCAASELQSTVEKRL